MSETGSQVATRSPGDLEPDGGAGAPLPFAQVTADDAGGLAVHGPQAPGGHLRTEDLGAVDLLGRVHVAERRDAVVVSGGLNLSPAEIEAALATHPAVIEVAVVGLPHRRWGARPVALVVLSSSAARAQSLDFASESAGFPLADALVDALSEAVRAQLSAPKVPDAFIAVPALPLGVMGKRPLAALRILAASGLSAEHRAAGLGASADHLEGREAAVGQGTVEDGRTLDALEAGPAHEGVLDAHDGVHFGRIVSGADGVFEGDGAPREPADDRVDDQALARVAGAPVVALRVDHRQAKAQARGHGGAVLAQDLAVHLQAHKHSVEHLLKGDVGVLEVPPEEHHTGAILFVESNRESVADHESFSKVGAPAHGDGSGQARTPRGGGHRA
jgi:hypothetical protein